MFKRIIALMMLLSVFSVHADVVSGNNLKTVFDELNYSLTVEWDQQDKKFYNEQMKKFQGEVAKLQAQGLSNAELVEFAKSQIKDEKTAKDLETVFNVIEINKLDQKEARALVLDTFGKSYSQGASWAGDVAIVAAAVILLILVVAIAASTPSSGGYTGGGCYDEYVCYDYYDYWGYYWYTDCYFETWCY